MALLALSGKAYADLACRTDLVPNNISVVLRGWLRRGPDLPWPLCTTKDDTSRIAFVTWAFERVTAKYSQRAQPRFATCPCPSRNVTS